MVDNVKTSKTFGKILAVKGINNLTVGFTDTDGEVVEVLVENLTAINLTNVQSNYEVIGDGVVAEIWNQFTGVEGSFSVVNINNAVRKYLLGWSDNAGSQGSVYTGKDSIAPEISITWDEFKNDGSLQVFGITCVKCDDSAINHDRASKDLSHSNINIPFKGRAVEVGGKSYATIASKEGLTEDEAAKFRSYVHNLRKLEKTELESGAAAAKLFNSNEE